MNSTNRSGKQHVRALCVALFAGLMSAVAAPACNDRASTSDACYPENRSWERDSFGVPLGFCQWERGDPAVKDHIPADSDVNGSDSYSFCFTPEEGKTCNACPAEETDALLRDEFERECGVPVQYFQRGCYTSSTDGDGKEKCCYKALIAPLCSSGN